VKLFFAGRHIFALTPMPFADIKAANQSEGPMDINIPKTRAGAMAIGCVSCVSSSAVVDAPVAVVQQWNHDSTFGGALARELGGGVLRGGLPGS